MIHYFWKECLEQLRSSGIWLMALLLGLTGLVMIAEARYFPQELAQPALLVGIFDLNAYLLPLLATFIASFSVFQEKEMRTALMLLTRAESVPSFVARKSLALHLLIGLLLIALYVLLVIPMRLTMPFELNAWLVFVLVTLGFVAIFVQLGVLIGAVCRNKMQLIGANILVWFAAVFLLDLLMLYFLPAVSFDNAGIFSWFYFLHPTHALRMTLETQLGLFSMTGLSRMMEEVISMPPLNFALINVVLWPLVFYGLTVWLGHFGASHD